MSYFLVIARLVCFSPYGSILKSWGDLSIEFIYCCYCCCCLYCYHRYYYLLVMMEQLLFEQGSYNHWSLSHIVWSSYQRIKVPFLYLLVLIWSYQLLPFGQSFFNRGLISTALSRPVEILFIEDWYPWIISCLWGDWSRVSIAKSELRF